MNQSEILNMISSLAKSKRFYSHLLEQIKESPEILASLEKQGFKDPVDLILFLEQ